MLRVGFVYCDLFCRLTLVPFVMYRKTHLLSLLIITLSSCGSLEPVTWQMGSSINASEVWDSGRNPNSPVLSLNCITANGPHHLLTGFNGFKEPASNLDRFMARLTIDCVEHIELAGKYVQKPNAPLNTTVLTTFLSFRTGSSERPINLANGEYPIGLLVTHTGNDYVKNLQFLFVEENGGILTDYTDPGESLDTITDYPSAPWIVSGPFPQSQGAVLQCASQEVMTGIRIRQNTSNGKIRMVGIDCQRLTRAESATADDES